MSGVGALQRPELASGARPCLALCSFDSDERLAECCRMVGRGWGGRAVLLRVQESAREDGATGQTVEAVPIDELERRYIELKAAVSIFRQDISEGLYVLLITAPRMVIHEVIQNVLLRLNARRVEIHDLAVAPPAPAEA